MTAAEDLQTAIAQLLNDDYPTEGLLRLRRLLSKAIASADRSVSIQGDVNGATITTGDGNKIVNIVFQSDGLTIDGKDFCHEDTEPLRALLWETLSPSIEIDWPKASQELLEEHFHLTTNPITQREDIAYEVPQVYVPLGLVERRRASRIRGDVLPEKGSTLYEENSDEDSYSNLAREFEITQKFEHEEFLEQVLRQRKSPKSKGKRLAIVGEPGAGKTTSLQQIARWLSEQQSNAIIIWISLADLQRDTIEAYLEQRWLQRIIRQAGGAEVLSTHKQAFADQLQRRPIWLILDGLDEMQSAGNPLNEIQRQMQEGGWLQQMRTIATCRLNLWDGTRNPLSDFDVYRTLDFSYPNQVEAFIEQWFAPRSNRRLGQMLRATLAESGKARIQDLVKNPLRLSLLCFSWYIKQGQLPQTQAELYRRFVDRIYEWKQAQFPTTSAQRAVLNQGLAELSIYALDCTGSRFRLRQDVVFRFLDKALPDGTQTLLDLALRLGWINQIGVDAEDPEITIYAFYHTTFEEYFAALGVEDERFFLNHDPEKPTVKEASYRIFEAQWRQVFLLWLGREEPALQVHKEALIQSLVEFDDRCGGFYRDRALAIAAVGLSEFVDCSASDVIIDRLLSWQFGHPNWIWQRWQVLISAQKLNVRKELAGVVLPQTDRQKVVRALTLMLQHEIKDDGIRKVVWAIKYWIQGEHDLDKYQDAAKRLGEIDPGNETAVRVLSRIVGITWDKYPHTCNNAAESLGKVGKDNAIALRTLLDVVAANQKVLDLSIFRRSASLRAIIYSFFGESVMVEILRRVTSIYSDSRLYRSRKKPSLFFQKLAEYSEKNKAIHWLNWRVVKFRYFHRDSMIGIARGLGEIEINSEAAVNALAQIGEMWRVYRYEDYSVWWEVVNSLGKVGEGNESSIRWVLSAVEATQERELTLLAVETLCKLSESHLASLRILLDIIQSAEDKEVRWAASEGVERIGIKNDDAIAELTDIIETTQDEDILLVAAKSLGLIDAGNTLSTHTLTSIAEQTQDKFVRGVALWFLDIIDVGKTAGSESIIQTLSQIFADKQHSSFQLPDRYRLAARIWERTRIDNGLAVQNLKNIIESTKNPHVHKNAIENLSKVGISDESAISTILQVLNATSRYWVRLKAAECLNVTGVGNHPMTKASIKTLRGHGHEEAFYRILVRYSETEKYPDFYRLFNIFSLPSLIVYRTKRLMMDIIPGWR